MSPQSLESSADPSLAFASETADAPTAEPQRASRTIQPEPAATIEPEPAFLRVPAASERPPLTFEPTLTFEPASPTFESPAFSSISEQPRTGNGRVPLIVTSAIAVGLLAGFAAGYGVAYRVIASAPAPTLVVAGPTNPPTADTAPVPEAASEPSLPTTREPVPPPVRQTEQRATAAQAVRSSAARVETPPTAPASSSAASNQTTGVIEIMSRPRGAQVSLDGTVIGLTPLSIPDVSEGMHDVRVELDGFSPWTASVRVMGGSRARVGASLDR